MNRLAKRQALIVALLFSGYASYYFCRSDLSVALPMLVEDLKRSGMSGDVAMIRMGAIVSFGVMAYAAGKFFLAGLGDVWGGRRSFLGGLSGALLFTIIFTLGGGLPVFTIAWIGNRTVQSMGWAGLVKVCSQWFSYKAYGSVIAILSLSFLIGDAVARQWMGLLIGNGFGWRWLFYLAAIVAGISLLANIFLLKETRREMGFPEPEVNPLNVFKKRPESSGGIGALLLPLVKNTRKTVAVSSSPPEASRSSFSMWWRASAPFALLRNTRKAVTPRPPASRSSSSTWRHGLVPFALLKNSGFLIVCFLSLCTTIVRETFNTWTPTYLHNFFGYTDSAAASTSAVFPALGAVSVVIAGLLGDRMGASGRAIVLFCGLAISTVGLGLMTALRSGTQGALPLLLIGLVALGLLGPYSYLAGAMALDFGGKEGGATSSGLIDGVGYLGGILAGDSVARVSVHYGWSCVFVALAVISGLSALAAGWLFFHQRQQVEIIGE